MRRLVFAAALFARLSSQAQAAEIADMVRDLNSLQNRMVTGDMAARDRAAGQFDAIEKEIAASDPAAFAEERTTRAAIIYLLLGGASSKLREIHEAKAANEKLAPLLGASLDYADARDAGAPKGLLAFKAREFSSVLGGHLALVQAGALIGEDNAQAIGLLDLARLLMPGSLVEEAALRREILLLAPDRDGDKLSLLSTRYASKYSGSPFARNFWSALQRMTEADPEILAHSVRFARVYEKAPMTDRVSYYLLLSRRALLAGKFGEAGRTVQLAEASAIGSDTQKRVSAYRSVVNALTDEKAASALSGLEAKELNPEDAALVQVASSVVAGLATREAERVAARSTEQDEAYDKADNVRQALNQSDELLKRAAAR